MESSRLGSNSSPPPDRARACSVRPLDSATVDFATDGACRVSSVSSNPGVHRWPRHDEHFTPEFKAQAVKLVTDQGKSPAQVRPGDLDLGESMM